MIHYYWGDIVILNIDKGYFRTKIYYLNFSSNERLDSEEYVEV